jgi:hypothetical protein
MAARHADPCFRLGPAGRRRRRSGAASRPRSTASATSRPDRRRPPTPAGRGAAAGLARASWSRGAISRSSTDTPKGMPIACPRWPRSWCGSRSTSSWHRRRRRRWLQRSTPTIPVVGLGLAQPVAVGSWKVWRAPAATSPASRTVPTPTSPASSCSCSRVGGPRRPKGAVLYNPRRQPGGVDSAHPREHSHAARSLDLPLVMLEARGPAHFDAAFAAWSASVPERCCSPAIRCSLSIERAGRAGGETPPALDVDAWQWWRPAAWCRTDRA